MHFDKRDLITIGTLSLVFFAIASYQLGSPSTPRTTWQATSDTTLVIDLSRPREVAAVRVLVKRGKATVSAQVGSPVSWSEAGQFEIPLQYYTWSDPLPVNSVTRYLRLEIYPHPYEGFEAVEVVLLGSDGLVLKPMAILGDGVSAANQMPWTDLPVGGAFAREPLHGTDPSRLGDEQELVRLPPSFPVESCFDEGYFVRTAETYLARESPYEWSHPPLAKLIIALSMAIFGTSPFGWRIPGVVFATLTIPVVYLLARTLLGSWIGAFSAAFFFTFEFMHFVLARVGIPDTYLVFFSLLSQLAFCLYFSNVLRDGWATSYAPLLSGFLFFSLAAATKWIALYGFAGMMLILLALRWIRLGDSGATQPSAIARRVFGRPVPVLPLFLGLAVLAYFSTYIPVMVAVGRSPAKILALQVSMYRLHSGMTDTHPYSSQWWTWPLMLRPVWLYVEYLAGATRSTVVVLGNPAVWWIGFPLVLALSAKAVLLLRRANRSWTQRDLAPIVIATVFFTQWLPYCLLSRIMFLYHFYSCAVVLCLAMAYFVDRYWATKWGRAGAIVLFAAVMILFIAFYPVLSGMPARDSYIDSLRWLGADRWEF